MKRVFVGFTLLLTLFLSPMADVRLFYTGPLMDLAQVLHLPSEFSPFVLAVVVVALFLKLCRIRERLAVPIPGIHLMTAATTLYIVTWLAAGGIVAFFAAAFQGSQNMLPLIVLAAAIAKVSAPIFLAAECALLVGAFRVLTNLRPSQL